MAKGAVCAEGACGSPSMRDSKFCEFHFDPKNRTSYTPPPITGEMPMSDDNWKHRSKGMRCETCMWFSEKETSIPGMVFGRCRRHAPTMSGFPAVYGTDWCGDHKLNEEKL